jgi:hypothetical protein
MEHYRVKNNSTVFFHKNHVTHTTFEVDPCKNIEKIPRISFKPEILVPKLPLLTIGPKILLTYFSTKVTLPIQLLT